MTSILSSFVEKVGSEEIPVSSNGTTTANREAPDKLSHSIQRMTSTRTDAKESPDRAFIPQRRI
jgi:hypothetical protein